MTSTPPPTSLSDPPSPTELQDVDPLAVAAEVRKMTGKSALRAVYLIVATAVSPPLGIGLRGSLPWGQISKDMTYFRKVTTSGTSIGQVTPIDGTKPQLTRPNAVIMGRKTWLSIPHKFRPLSGRTNVILTRSGDIMTALADEASQELRKKITKSHEGSQTRVDVVKKTRSIELKYSDSSTADVFITTSLEEACNINAREIFCIGGAEIYKLFLQDMELRPQLRVLQTEVRRADGADFDCDTFWPESFSTQNWIEASKDEVRHWTSIEVPQGDAEWIADDKAGVVIRVRGWRSRSPE